MTVDQSNRFECGHCGWVSIPPPPEQGGPSILFHPCPAMTRRPRRRALPARAMTDREEILEAARQVWRDTSPLYANFADQFDDRDLLRRIDEEE